MDKVKPWAAICRFGGIGDNLIASSVLPLLASRYNVEVFTETPNHVIYENNPHIAKLTVKQLEEMPRGDALAWQKWFRDRSSEYELFVNLSHSCENLLAMQSGQTQFFWRKEWRRKHCGKNYLESVHDIVGVPHVFGPKFYPTDLELEKAHQTRARLQGKIVGWLVSGSRIDKIYPYAAHAIARIIQECDATVLLFGAPNEKDISLARGIGDHVRAALGNLDRVHAAIAPPKQDEWTLQEPGQRVKQIEKSDPVWPLRRALTQIQLCDMVIGPDTGMMWSVAMEQVPKIALLSHASPENITKHWKNTISLHADQNRVPCWPCHQLHDDPSTCKLNTEKTAAACMSDITAEQVVAAVKHHFTQQETNENGRYRCLQ